MKNKYYGDIPEDHRKLLKKLIDQEDWFNERGNGVPFLVASTAFVCLAHDYAHLQMEEEANRLILKAEKYTPGYFKDAIHAHAEKDEEFARLVNQLKNTLALESMVSLGFRNE